MQTTLAREKRELDAFLYQAHYAAMPDTSSSEASKQRHPYAYGPGSQPSSARNITSRQRSGPTQSSHLAVHAKMHLSHACQFNRIKHGSQPPAYRFSHTCLNEKVSSNVDVSSGIRADTSTVSPISCIDPKVLSPVASPHGVGHCSASAHDINT